MFFNFKEMYEDKYPKAVNNLTKDVDRLLTFFDFPAAHWKHIRSTNAIEYPKGRLRAPRLQRYVYAKELIKIRILILFAKDNIRPGPSFTTVMSFLIPAVKDVIWNFYKM